MITGTEVAIACAGLLRSQLFSNFALKFGGSPRTDAPNKGGRCIKLSQTILVLVVHANSRHAMAKPCQRLPERLQIARSS